MWKRRWERQFKSIAISSEKSMLGCQLEVESLGKAQGFVDARCLCNQLNFLSSGVAFNGLLWL